MHSILIAAMLTALQGSPAISKDAADLKELYRLEAVWNDAHVKGDADAPDRLWSNDLIVTVASMPVMNKTDSLAMVRSGRMPFVKYETSELCVQRNAADTVQWAPSRADSSGGIKRRKTSITGRSPRFPRLLNRRSTSISAIGIATTHRSVPVA
jgi:hypothetical protein